MPPNMNQEETTKTTEKFGTDITALRREGKLDPVIVEIARRTIDFSRRTKNNPVLIGEPGSWKLHVVEALAQRIVKGNVPASLKDKRPLPRNFQPWRRPSCGQFEDRLVVLKEVEDAAGDYYRWNSHHGWRWESEGSMDAGNMLKPASW